MSIRKTKSRFARPAAKQERPNAVEQPIEVNLRGLEDPLVFTTANKRKPAPVDLREFSTGATTPAAPSAAKVWGGGFTGRPELILELAPAIRQKLQFASKAVVTTLKSNLRWWWRFFDGVEAGASESNVGSPVRSVAQLSHLHAELARKGATKGVFTAFAALARDTREKQGLPELVWRAPEETQPCSDLPEARRFKPLFDTIRRGWYSALDRWARLEQLMSGEIAAESEADVTLKQNGLRFRDTRTKHEEANARHPKPADFESQFSNGSAMARQGFVPKDVYSYFYPTAHDIRMAFHLAISGCGWNVSTMLDLEIDCKPGGDPIPFLRDNPANSSVEGSGQRTRYILTGHKSRGDSYHDVHGYWESMRSPGVIIKTLVERTWPLRMELLRQAKEIQLKLDTWVDAETGEETITLRKKRDELLDASTRVWIYWDGRGIQRLTSDNFSAAPAKGKSWLGELVAAINTGRPAEQHVPKISASDFRDIYAMWVYEATGGDLLAVSRALNHRKLATTARYLWKMLLNRAAGKKLVKFEEALWRQIQEKRRIDSTVLRQLMEQGDLSDEYSIRLEDYRSLKKSRLNAGCAASEDSPNQFHSGEQAGKPCATHRCPICPYARVGRDSREGYAMRLAELNWLEASLPIEHFIRDGDLSFAHERDTTREILRAFFDPAEVARDVANWTTKIESGEHCIPELTPA